MRRAWSGAIAAFAAMVAGCHRATEALVAPGRSAVALSAGPNTSMTYLTRTDDGVLAIDLGWWGGDRSLDQALRALDATPSDVRHVFLTHSHRDHVAAWPLLRRARFVLAATEVPRLFGEAPHRAWIPRWADRLKRPRLPRRGELTIVSFAQDTSFVVGTDTVRAYLVPGHTEGTAVYLLRGVLFAGDAITWSRWRGFAPAKRGYSDDRRAAARNLAALWPRLPAGAVQQLCTAHAHCAPFTPGLVASLAR